MGVLEELEENWKKYAIGAVMGYFTGKKEPFNKVKKQIKKQLKTFLEDENDENN